MQRNGSADILGRFVAAIAALLIVTCSLGCGVQSTAATVENHTPAEQLAVIDNGQMDTSGSTLIQSRLNSLCAKFPESESRIADMTCKAQELL